MSNSWDDYADGWDINPDVIEYAQRAFDSLEHCIDLSNLRVLDFGCGTGLLTEKIAKQAAEVIAIDTSAKMIDVLNAKSLNNVSALCCELSQPEINSNPRLNADFDLIVASSVCAFVPNYLQTLQDLKRLLKPGGLFIQWDWQQNGNDDFGFTNKMMHQAFTNTGLRVKTVSPAFSLTTNGTTMTVLMGIAKNPL
jgi:2-polyprenyl-3-methyl-5-hydroxy-6-metoxy-1,4-benzoquinol methylase